MSKEFTCNQCKKKTITEREDTRHTDYSYGLCEECKPKPEPEPEPGFFPGTELLPEEPPEEPRLEENPLACRDCDFIAKTEFGLKSHMRVHKQ